MGTILKPPTPLNIQKSVFLAGSIEMGVAENWQVRMEKALEGIDCKIYNPRRDDWDSSWEQKASNPQFNEQVSWELSALEQATVIALYFDPTTKSPISLLEFGLFHDKMVVLCPEGFWRKGNVDIVCQRYNVPMVADFDALISEVKKRLQ